MKKIVVFAILLFSFPVVCLAASFQVDVGPCSFLFFDDWGFIKYTGDFDKLSARDQMFYNSKGDVVVLSVFSDAYDVPQETKSELFNSANSIVKSFQAEDGSSIVTLGEIDNCPRITIIDESDFLSKTQWFIFAGEDVVYISFQSADKSRSREYNSSLYNTKVR